MAVGVAPEMFIAGAWCAARSGETFTATSPATGEPIATVPQGDRGDARAAIAAARAAAEGWAGLTAFDRAAKMHAVGDIIEARRDELALTLTLDQGKPLHAEAFGEVDELVEYWRMAAEDAKRLGGELPNSISAGKRVMLVRRPVGVVGVISPWNWPYTMPAELIAPALAAGNAVVWTPAPSTAVSGLALARAIADADLPAGVFNIVTGPGPVVGDEIARNPGTDGVAFIGSTATGRLVAAAAAGPPTSTPPLRRRWPPAFSAPGRAAPPGNGCWCTPRWRRSSPSGWPRVSPSRSAWGTRSRRTPLWDRSTTRRSPPRWMPTSATPWRGARPS
jgi:acyl-CoA reductase-like NAD-dependent aldehyde dehydrogenase